MKGPPPSKWEGSLNAQIKSASSRVARSKPGAIASGESCQLIPMHRCCEAKARKALVLRRGPICGMPQVLESACRIDRDASHQFVIDRSHRA
jgi:hypothetical protein